MGLSFHKRGDLLTYNILIHLNTSYNQYSGPFFSEINLNKTTYVSGTSIDAKPKSQPAPPNASPVVLAWMIPILLQGYYEKMMKTVYSHGNVSKPSTPVVHIKIAGIYGCSSP